MSVNSTSPETLFGGTWVRIQGRFLLGAGSNSANTNETFGKLAANQINRNVNEQGGEVKHKLTTSEMPSHSHRVLAYGSSLPDRNGFGPSGNSGNTWGFSGIGTLLPGAESNYLQIASTGSSNEHNNMPPYYVVYMWRRTA